MQLWCLVALLVSFYSQKQGLHRMRLPSDESTMYYPFVLAKPSQKNLKFPIAPHPMPDAMISNFYHLNNLFNFPLSGTPPFRLPRSLYNRHASLKCSGAKGPSSPCNICTSLAISTISPTKTLANPEITIAIFCGTDCARIWFDNFHVSINHDTTAVVIIIPSWLHLYSNSPVETPRNVAFVPAWTLLTRLWC